jgi:hypothetical protein
LATPVNHARLASNLLASGSCGPSLVAKYLPDRCPLLLPLPYPKSVSLPASDPRFQ